MHEPSNADAGARTVTTVEFASKTAAPPKDSVMDAAFSGALKSAAASAGGSGPFIATSGRARRLMNWLFTDKKRLFWVMQIAGWLGFFFFHALSVSTLVDGFTRQAIAYSTASTLIGFVMTSLVLRPIYRFARRQSPIWILTVAGLGTLALTIVMYAMKVFTVEIIFGDEWRLTRLEELGSDDFLLLLRQDLPPNLFLLCTWAGFYFGVNYYLRLRDESQRALVAARLADQAQLKMLRYQLNPHFLFNTLNAISTLVLMKDAERANDMLTKLSAFLRYSLDSDPLQKTSLAEELRALQLYLDIEKARFTDRLSIEYDIDDAAKAARVPSLILQPAIENAIKYAIARMEAGGVVRVKAFRVGDDLRLQVCDNGPDAPDNPCTLLDDAGAGVGLANMRDRLAHLYGERQSFKLSKLDPCGLCVTLTLPFETGRP